ncbi:MAG: hypothetical protein WCY26_11700 [Thiohalobacteraceae bacterium]
MRNTLISIGLLGAIVLTSGGTMVMAADKVVEIGGQLQDWNLASHYIVIAGKRYRTEPGVSIHADDGTPLTARDLRRDMDVSVYEVNDRITEIVIIRTRPAPEPQ